MLSTNPSPFPPNSIQTCVFCGKLSTQMDRHHSVHNEDPSLKLNFLGTLLIAKPISKKGYRCPFTACPFAGLPAALYTHILSHVVIKTIQDHAHAPGITPQKRPLDDPFSPYPETLVGDDETPLKKQRVSQRVSLASPSTPLSPTPSSNVPVPPTPTPNVLVPRTPTPIDIESMISSLENYMNDYAGVCALHGLSSSLPVLDPHTDLRTCDLVNANFYRGHYRKSIRRYINKPTLCSSCGGCKRFDHPVWACDNDSLQDFWLGIPYLVFTIPAIAQIVFDFLGVHHTDAITESIQTFGTWLYTPSAQAPIISSAYPQLYDLIHAFFQSASQLTSIDWAIATQQAASRVASLQES